MSYDLYFEAGSGKKLNKKSFAAHFAGRANYNVANGQAVYENEDTAVAFIFDEPDDSVVAFNLNYFRPHVFGLEAAVELEAFAEAFEAVAIDPQADEAGEERSFTREPFLQAWNEGNLMAYRSLLKEMAPVHTWPSRRIRDVWEWNYWRPPEPDRLADSMFVPGIFAVELEGKPMSVAIWPPDCAILLPEVDLLLVPIAQAGDDDDDTALVKWEEALPALIPYRQQGKGLPRYPLMFDQWPQELAAFLSTPRQPVGQLNGIGLDQILDQELVEEASTV